MSMKAETQAEAVQATEKTSSGPSGSIDQSHVSATFTWHGQEYKSNAEGIANLFKALKGQRNSLRLALQWTLQRGLLSAQNSQKAPIVMALDLISSESPELLKKSVAYTQHFAPFLTLTWQEQVNSKGAVSVDYKRPPSVAFKKKKEAARKLSAALDSFLSWKQPKQPREKQSTKPITEKQVENLAERLEASEDIALEKVVAKALRSGSPLTMALNAIDGVEKLAVEGAFQGVSANTLLEKLTSLAKVIAATSGGELDSYLSYVARQAKEASDLPEPEEPGMAAAFESGTKVPTTNLEGEKVG